jgi:hypothetical protein
MRLVGFILICCALVAGCISQPYTRVRSGDVDLGVGSVDLPPGYTQGRDRGIDTDIGHFISADRHLLIQYDIGDLAGVRATHNPDGREVLSSSEVTTNDLQALIVVFRSNNKKQVVISFPEGGPANFFADIENDADVNAVRKLALSYRLK